MIVPGSRPLTEPTRIVECEILLASSDELQIVTDLIPVNGSSQPTLHLDSQFDFPAVTQVTDLLRMVEDALFR